MRFLNLKKMVKKMTIVSALLKFSPDTHLALGSEKVLTFFEGLVPPKQRSLRMRSLWISGGCPSEGSVLGGDKHGSRQRAPSKGSQPSPEFELPTWTSPTPQEMPFLAETPGFGKRVTLAKG